MEETRAAAQGEREEDGLLACRALGLSPAPTLSTRITHCQIAHATRCGAVPRALPSSSTPAPDVSVTSQELAGTVPGLRFPAEL